MSLRINELYSQYYNYAPAAGMQADVSDADKLDTAQKVLFAGGIIPTVRRVGSLPDSIEEENYTRAGLLAGVAAMSLPGDLREIMRAVPEVKGLLNGKLPSAVAYQGQHAMNLFDGTFVQKLANKYKWLGNLDKSLFDTRLRGFLEKTFKFSVDSVKDLKIPGFKIGNIINLPERVMPAFNFNGNFAQKLLGNTLLRIPVLGLALGGIIELPSLYKSIADTEGTALDKAKAFGKQLIKSAGYVGLVAAGIAVGGALLGATGIGALVGMAIGSAIGITASQGLNKLVDWTFSKNEKKEEVNPFAKAPMIA